MAARPTGDDTVEQGRAEQDLRHLAVMQECPNCVICRHGQPEICWCGVCDFHVQDFWPSRRPLPD